MLQVQFADAIKREQDRQSRITIEYRAFLDSLDEMRQRMLETFSDMPKSMVYIIHHHAHELLDGVWKSSDEHSKALFRARFTEFLKTVYDDTAKALLGQEKKLPKATLRFIEAV